MVTKIKELLELLHDLGFSRDSLKESVPRFVKNLSLFLGFGASVNVFLGYVYFEAAISALPAPLRMGLHKYGGSLGSYFSHGFTVLAAMATDYSTASYLSVLLVALVIFWITLRFTSLILALTNPLTPLRVYATMPEEGRAAIATGVFSLVRDASDDVVEPAIKAFNVVVRFHLFLRVLDLFILGVLIIYVFLMATIFLIDALGLVSVAGTKCLAFFGAVSNSLDAHARCRGAGLIDSDLYWQPAFALILVIASWVSLRHAHTFRALRMAITILASMSLLLFSIRLGELKGPSDLALWRVQITNEETEGATLRKSRNWLLVYASADHLLLFDEDSNALYDYRDAQKQGLIFLEQVAFRMVGKGTTANPTPAGDG